MTQLTAETIEELLAVTAGRLEDLAEEAGVSYSALYSWATGRRRPSRRNLDRLAELAEDRAERLAELAARLGADPGSGASDATD